MISRIIRLELAYRIYVVISEGNRFTYRGVINDDLICLISECLFYGYNMINILKVLGKSKNQIFIECAEFVFGSHVMKSHSAKNMDF